MKSLTLIFALACLLNLPVGYAESAPESPPEPIEYSQAELEQMLAPIALYPDSVLTHILIAATYPLEVIEAERWVTKNPDLSNNKLMDKGEQMEWDPSVVALLPFANILTKMSDELTWTRQLGDAFLSNEEQVLASIQSLRQKADSAGTLAQMENVDVAREDNNIAITPADPQIVYVPYYDARVVYGPWYWHSYPPVYWAHYPSYYSPHYYAAYPAPFYWHSAVHISVGWFFGGFHWGNHHVVVNHHPHSYYYRHHNNHHHGHVSHYSGGKKHYSSGKKHYSSGKPHTAKQSSKGYQRWQHQPSHRKSIAYKNERVAKHYKSSKPSVSQASKSRKQDRKLLALNKYNGSQNTSSNKNYKVKKGNNITSSQHQKVKQQLGKTSVRSKTYKSNNTVAATNSNNRKSSANNLGIKRSKPSKSSTVKANTNKVYKEQSRKPSLNASAKQHKQLSNKNTYKAPSSNYKQKANKPSYSKPSYKSSKQRSAPKQRTAPSRNSSPKSSRKSSSRPKH
ncbi:DUF3300 domain-containing protein [Thalassotalea fonticola]|uniref:DUF3300 domain-containing protein n=1 Tax=Thalassotalea fonticola TaxID=3065649 RepID=A0ABZ0GKY8_9GAMM|nr:DUF3300 domain-containing protein [Colwelliaceae bacterium S1-1]